MTLAGIDPMSSMSDGRFQPLAIETLTSHAEAPPGDPEEVEVRRNPILLALLAAIPICALGSGIASGGEIPPILNANLEHVEGTYPVWVSAEAAFTPDGELDANLFHPHLLKGLRKTLATAPNPDRGCIEEGTLFQSWLNPPDRSDLPRSIRHSERVLLALVVETSAAFDRGLHGHLIRVVSQEVFQRRIPLPWYCFFIPVGEFIANAYTTCKDDYQYPRLPRVGDEMILLVLRSEDSAKHYLDLMWPRSLIVLDADQKVIPSKELRLPENSSRGELLSSLQNLQTDRSPLGSSRNN